MVDTFRFEDVTAVWNGVPIEGFAPDTAIEATRTTEAYRRVTGSGGASARASSGDRGGTVTFTLLQTSKTNAALTAFAVLDEQNGDGVGPLLIKDLGGNDVILAEAAWIQKRPDAMYGNTVQNRVWVLEADNLEILVGGAA